METLTNENPSAEPTSDRVYRILKDRILNGESKPGERLKERDLVAELGASRTPIREALRQLSSEGLVVTRPRRGIIVADLEPREVDEIFELGVILESFAAKLAAASATEADIDRLKSLLNLMEQALSDEEETAFKRYIQLDREFHDAISIAAQNGRLRAILQQTINLRVLSQTFQQYRREDYRQSLSQHRNIAAAIESRDPEWAESAMRTHTLTGRLEHRLHEQ